MGKATYENLTLDEERALYGLHHAEVRNCTFAGPADGESALKECSELLVSDCDFELRYPFWHVRSTELHNCRMTDTCRAALWYDSNIRIEDSVLGGIKALRECEDVCLVRCKIQSPEFGWFCRKTMLESCTLESEYPFFECRNLEMKDLKLKGKYSFQYVEDAVIRNSYLDTKDAFWYSKNVTVVDSVVKGEYLAWYSENLRLVRCRIIGTQPLCYARGLVLEDCEMEGTDLSFENSEVDATVRGEILSVKNPVHGRIAADRIGEVILDENLRPGADCQILCRQTELCSQAVLT